MTRALITGGAGFVGSHLTEALLDHGYEVEMIDDLSTGSVRHLDAIKRHHAFSYVIDTVLNRPLMAELVDRADVVFHLAAVVGVRLIMERPVRTIETNIKATELVLELAAKKHKRVLLTSTSEVYGKLDKPLFGEDDDLVLGATSRTRWCYAASKIIDEFLAKAYHHEHGLPVTIVRLFNTIGPRQTGHYGMVVPRFICQALEGKPITVYGDGTQRRSFTWVGDVVEAMINLCERGDVYGEIFNVGHTKDIAIGDLARLIKTMTGSSSPVVLMPYREIYGNDFEDMRRRMPDISKLRALIGYEPKLGLGGMLEQIIDYFSSTR